MGENATPQMAETVSSPITSNPASRNTLPSFSSFTNNSAESQPSKRSTSDINSKGVPQASARRCASEERAPTKTVQLKRLSRRLKSESHISHIPDSLCGRSAVFPCSTEVSRPIMIWQREEREEMKKKAQFEREKAARVTKFGLDCNILANREVYSEENHLQPLFYSIIPSEHKSPGNIDLKAPNSPTTFEISQSENTDSFHLTESEKSEAKNQDSEHLNSETEGDQQTGEDLLSDLKTSNQETLSDITEVIVSPDSETVSNIDTSTLTSKNILPLFSSFIKGSAESQPQRKSTSDTDSKTFPQASGRRCASEERALTKSVQLHRIFRRSRSKSQVSHKPDSSRGGSIVFPCPTEVSRPIVPWQQEQREEMKKKAQREREKSARVTKLGLDCNILTKREEYSLENYLSTLTMESEGATSEYILKHDKNVV